MKYLFTLPLLAVLLFTSCNKEERIEQEKIEQNQQLLMGVWESGEILNIRETDMFSFTTAKEIKEMNFTSSENVVCSYCYGSVNYNWSCTSDQVVLSGISDEINEFQIIVLDSDESILEGSRTYTNEYGELETHKVRVELKRHE
ncbi:MAG: hypothetical protein CMD35_06610 [Flavobacteriales bacterium]|nr:hypothetical protein [Flavobacteriales bacterium]